MISIAARLGLAARCFVGLVHRHRLGDPPNAFDGLLRKRVFVTSDIFLIIVLRNATMNQKSPVSGNMSFI
jgi:hypothetical protein